MERISRREALGLLLAGLAARGAQAAPPPLIAVFISSQDAYTQALIDSFGAGVSFGLRMTYTLSGSREDLLFVRENLEGFTPALVLSVGDRALSVAAREFTHRPLIYADAAETWRVVGHEKAVELSQRSNPALVVPLLRQGVPTVRRVGAIRHASDPEPLYWEQMAQACTGAGLSCEILEVAGAEEIPNAIRGLSRTTDLLWLQQSPRLWSPGALAGALHEAHLRHYPVLGFAAEQLSGPQPAALAVAQAPEEMGMAAAELACQILIEELPPELLVAPWVEPKLLGNREAMHRSNLPITRHTAQVFHDWMEG